MQLPSPGYESFTVKFEGGDKITDHDCDGGCLPDKGICISDAPGINKPFRS